MKVLAVDPGYDRMGVAVLEQTNGKEQLLFSSCIETDRTEPFSRRLLALGETLEQLFNTHTPDAVAIETLFFNKNQKTAVGVLQARGVVMYLGEKYKCRVFEFGPQEIKIAVTGFGKSDKQAVFDMVRRLVSNVPEKAHDDEFDAIATGITCLAHHHNPNH